MFFNKEASEALLLEGQLQGSFRPSPSAAVSAAAGAEPPTKRQRVAAAEASSSASTFVDAAAEPGEGCITVFCDRCGKARILKEHEQGTLGAGDDEDSEWYCSALDGLRDPPLRNRDARGCLAVDDKLEQVCGIALSMVLDQVGVLTRAALCATSADSFDAGELHAELAHCIRRAQDAEIEDILAEVFDSGGGCYGAKGAAAAASGGGGGGGGDWR